MLPLKDRIQLTACDDRQSVFDTIKWDIILIVYTSADAGISPSTAGSTIHVHPTIEISKGAESEIKNLMKNIEKSLLIKISRT